MDRDTAVQRIKDGLAFRTGTALDSRIVLRLQEAQRDLEKGKTLPKFLLQESQTLTLAADASTVSLPAGFIRDDDNLPIFYRTSTSLKPLFLERKRFLTDSMLALLKSSTTDETVAAPRIYVIRNSTIDFVTTADQAYTLYWNYYKAADTLDNTTTNTWLTSAPEWLIGEAGFRMAWDLRDGESKALFDDMRQRARAAIFGDTLALEDSGGPIQMGGSN